MRTAIINVESGEVVNVIELPDDYDPEVEGAYQPPEGFVIQIDPDFEAEVGGEFQNGSWIAPTPPEIVETPTKVDVQDQIAALTDLLVAKGTLTKGEVAQLNLSLPKAAEIDN